VSPADYYDWRRMSEAFSEMSAQQELARNLTGVGEPARLAVLAVTPEFLDTIGIPPAAGRGFEQGEDVPGNHRRVLLTDRVWRGRFGGDRGIVGRSVLLDGASYLVVGILPPRFWWPSHPDVLVPLALSDHDRALRGAHFLTVTARLRPGVTLEQARTDLDRIGRQLAAEYPAANAHHAPFARGLHGAFVAGARTPLLVLLGAVGLVLLIACANVATLLLARATQRQKELGIRSAIGAGRGRLVRQLVTESLVLALSGGTAGAIIAAWVVALGRAHLPADFAALPGVSTMAVDGRVLLAALAAAVVTGTLFGILPALVTRGGMAPGALNEESRGATSGTAGRRVRSMLIVSELALSAVLLVAAILLIVSFNRLTDVSPGFSPRALVSSRVFLPAGRYGEFSQSVAFYDTLLARLRSAPGVAGVGLTTALPFSGVDSRLDLAIENHAADDADPMRIHPRLVSPDYFKTLGVPLLRGRSFTDQDLDGGQNVAVINEAAARRYWNGADPIGSRISIGAPDEWRTVVGVVASIRHTGLEAEPEAEAYMPYRQRFTSLGSSFPRELTVALRMTDPSAGAGPLLRTIIHDIDAEQPLGPIRTMNDLIDESVAARRLDLLLLTAFAAAAILLSAAGLYGVMAYVVAQRTREIGVRMALGATPRSVLALVFREAGWLTCAGIALGLGGARTLTGVLATMLFGVTATEPSVYLGVAIGLGAIAVLAVAVPVRRAAHIDPVAALRR
jgi:putative ABC transport system permease protein